ncbi:MAG: 3-deoxy-D-manno-octulosonic acid transferase [Bacteroidales bacterium]|nr:3-deoxy-D-manno-octulosonic acid transferase [Bacteroidales bacterium]
MRGLYTLAIRAYTVAVKDAALFGNPKAKQWVEGRRQRPEPGNDQSPWVWFHAASLGEFEQGRPVIEALKKEHPDIKVSLTFFSPSGYEIRKNYPLADEVLYLPVDTLKNARQWVERHHFVAAFFIKYEFWFNYMTALDEKHIPLYYISLILKPDQYFFKWYGGWFRKQLKHVSHFFVQDDTTMELLKGIGFDNVTRCGDTRFDRVAAIAKQAKTFPEIEAFIHGRQCIIAGSSWPPDEKLLIPYIERLPENYCMIIAPHDISEKHIRQIRESLTSINPDKVYLIDTVGILSQLYQYARFVYIGGGFGVNIHNIQEPVTFGCPVVFGPKYKSFKEAVDLVSLGGAFSINGQEELNKTFDRLINDEAHYQQASEICKKYLKSQLGATDAILKEITSTFSF